MREMLNQPNRGHGHGIWVSHPTGEPGTVLPWAQPNQVSASTTSAGAAEAAAAMLWLQSGQRTPVLTQLRFSAAAEYRRLRLSFLHRFLHSPFSSEIFFQALALA